MYVEQQLLFRVPALRSKAMAVACHRKDSELLDGQLPEK